MFSEKLLDHFENPRNVGALDEPALHVRAENPICGDILDVWARLGDDGRVAATGYRTRGCTAAIATGSALTELLAGRTAAELAELRRDAIEEAVGGLPNESKHAAILAEDAVKLLAREAGKAS